MRVLSRLKTSIAYDASQPKGHKVVIKPGHNVLTDRDEAVLKEDSFFAKHVQLGHLAVLPNEEPKPASAPVAAEVVDDPRAQQPGESKAAWKARLKALDNPAPPSQLSAEDQSMIAAFNALETKEARDGYTAMLDDRQKEILAQSLDTDE